MNEDIIKNISKDLDISDKQATTVLDLLNEGNTIPFIARYRKEATGGLDEEKIKAAWNYINKIWNASRFALMNIKLTY